MIDITSAHTGQAAATAAGRTAERSTARRRGDGALRAALVALVAGAAIFATLGSGEESGKGSNGGSTTSAAADGSAPAADGRASTQQNPIPLGTDVEVAAGWNMKVNSAELNADSTLAQANQFQTPEAGKQFVAVNVTVTNASDQPGSPMFEMKVSLLPPSGVAIDEAMVVDVADDLDLSAQMQPGVSATGVLVFEVPTDQVDGTVMLGQSQFTMDEAKDQKFFAIR